MKNTINDFLDFIQGARNRKTYIAYRGALETFCKIVGDDAPLTKETYVRFLRKTTDMNPSTQAQHRSAIKGLYYFAAVTDPTIQTSFFQHIDRQFALKPGKRLILFNREGIEQIIQYCDTMRNKIDELRDRAFILLLADSGLRVHEACNLRIGYVDLLEMQAVIIGKGNKQAIVRFSNRAADAIRDYLRERGNTAKSLPLFIRHDKRAGDKILSVSPGGMWYAIKQRAKEASVDPTTIRVHDFRHYFVTVVYHAKGIKAAQKYARHERIETTGRYAHLVEDDGEVYDEIFNH